MTGDSNNVADEEMEDVVVFLKPETKEAVEAQLDYGDSRSGWIRDAVDERLARED